MSVGTAAMLVGVFGVPLVLLWLGHRLRRQSERHRRVFWGALSAYGLAALAALWVSLRPAAMWSSDDTVRGLVGFWAPLLASLLGGIVGFMTSPSKD